MRIWFFLLTTVVLASDLPAQTKPPASRLEPIVLGDDGTSFVTQHSKKPFRPWGFNYVGSFGKIVEEQWASAEGWQNLEADFAEMRELGANVIRVHLQTGTYMETAEKARPEELERLRKLLDLAEKNGLYLDLTGLGCYHPERLPAWFDALPEAGRWQVQARFWEAIAQTCSGHPAVFCYNLMNEPVITEATKEDKYPWLGGEMEGFFFVQRISKDPGGRDRNAIAAAWVKQMTTAIRQHHKDSLVTVGVIPWALVFKGAKPVFYTPEAAQYLDFVSIHVYPKSGKIDDNAEAIGVYDIGKPLVIEEFFPLGCNMEELKTFMDRTGGKVDGWISHYFGNTVEEHRAGAEPGGAAVASFLEFWRKKAPAKAAD